MPIGRRSNEEIAILAIGLTALAVTACAPNYYDRPYSSGYADRDRDGVPNRYDRDGDNDGVPNAYDRDRDNDGVPNSADRRPNNPYRN